MYIPEITIRDDVSAQYKLITEKSGISNYNLFAVGPWEHNKRMNGLREIQTW